MKPGLHGLPKGGHFLAYLAQGQACDFGDLLLGRLVQEGRKGQVDGPGGPDLDGGLLQSPRQGVAAEQILKVGFCINLGRAFDACLFRGAWDVDGHGGGRGRRQGGKEDGTQVGASEEPPWGG